MAIERFRLYPISVSPTRLTEDGFIGFNRLRAIRFSCKNSVMLSRPNFTVSSGASPEANERGERLIWIGSVPIRGPDESYSYCHDQRDSSAANHGSDCIALRKGVFTRPGARQMYSAALAFAPASSFCR
jgi:hypothetical protein